MPRKLVSDPYRGWYSWETHFNAAMRMSTQSMWDLKLKNEKELLYCKRHLDKITFDQRIETSEHSKTVKSLRCEYNRLVAFKKVSHLYNLQLHDRLNGNRSVSSPMKESKNVPTGKPAGENKWKKILKPHMDRVKQNICHDETKNVYYSYNLFPCISLHKAKTSCSLDQQKHNDSVSRSLLTKEGALTVPEKLRSEKADQNWSRTLASVKGIVKWKTLLQDSNVRVGPKIKPQASERSVLPGGCRSIYALKKMMKKKFKEALEFETRRKIPLPPVRTRKR